MSIIKELILQDKLDEALNKLRKLDFEDSHHSHDNIILLISRLRALKNRFNQGILTEGAMLIEKNKIRIATMDLFNDSYLKGFRETDRNINESRAALVIGCDQYKFAHSLPAAKNDANDISSELTSLNFNVSTLIDPSNNDLKNSISQFKKTLIQKTPNTCLFYFAGHGIQIEGSNYLVTKELDLNTESDAKENCISVDHIFEQITRANCDVNIVILDVCRNNPLSRNLKPNKYLSRGLAPVIAPKGSIIAFSTSPGKVAIEGIARNGLYTGVLLEQLTAPNLSILKMFEKVREKVISKSLGKQISWESTSLIGDFFFNPIK